MKDHYEIKKRDLPYYDEIGFRELLKNLAIEHGCTGRVGTLRFLFRRNFDNLLQLIANVIPLSRLRVKLQKMRGVKIGKKATIGPRCVIDPDYPNYCIIEEGATLSGYNIILCHNQPLNIHKNIFESFVAPTIIGKNADLAIGVIVLPGVKIGENSVIGAGAVVTKDIPPNCLAVGIPAKVIREYKVKNGIPIGIKSSN